MKHLIAAAALLAGSAVLAQSDSATLHEVVVTANKFPQKQNQTGKVVTVIGREQIERSAGRTVAQLLNEQAGVTINGALNNLGSNQTLYLRGASSGRTLILLDGIPVYDPSLIGNEFDLNLISLNNVESIEICRGAQSTLYGSDAVAGVVNIITVKKETDQPFRGKVTATGGRFGTFRGNAQLYGKADKLTYTARYARLQTKGFSAAHDSSGGKAFDRDGYRGDAASALLQYQATPALSVKSFLQYSRYTTDMDAAAFTDEKDFSIRNRSTIAGAGFRYQKAALRLTGNYQYSDIYRNYRNDSLDVPGFAKYVTDDYYGKGQFLELYANIALGGGFSLLQGADYRFSSMNNQYYSLSAFGPFSTEFKDTTQSQASLYASLLYNAVNEKLNVELGGRLNVHSRYGSNRTITFNPSYNFNAHYRIFGSIATGFKAPTLYHLYSSYGNRNLQPEHSVTYEAGVQQQHEKVGSRLVLFRRNIRNGIDFDNVAFRYYNFIRQRVNGAEAEVSWKPGAGLSFSANYTYLHPEERAQSRLTAKDTVYGYLLRRPDHSVNLTAVKAFGRGLLVSVSGKWVSSRYDLGGYRVPDVLLDDYLLLNAYAEWKFGAHLKVFADAQNLTGATFYEVRGYNALPFLFNTGVTLEW